MDCESAINIYIYIYIIYFKTYFCRFADLSSRKKYDNTHFKKNDFFPIKNILEFLFQVLKYLKQKFQFQYDMEGNPIIYSNYLCKKTIHTMCNLSW